MKPSHRILRLGLPGCLIALALLASACSAGAEPTEATAGSEAEAAALPTEAAPMVVKLFYPNEKVINLAGDALNQCNGIQLPVSGLDESIHLEERAFQFGSGWASCTAFCSGNYAYIEKEAVSTEFTGEALVNQLFGYTLSEEDQQSGFFNSLTGLELVSLEKVIDTNGEINSSAPGGEYLHLRVLDHGGYFTVGGGEPYMNWVDEFSGRVGGLCYWEVVAEQISATLAQVYPDCVRWQGLTPNENDVSIYYQCEAQ